MNTIIVFLYLAEFIGKICNISLIGLILFALMIIAGFLFILLEKSTEYAADDELIIGLSGKIKKLSIMFFVCLSVFILTPSKTFIYTALGLKVGEYSVSSLVDTEKFKKVSQIIDLKLDEVLKELQEGK